MKFSNSRAATAFSILAVALLASTFSSSASAADVPEGVSRLIDAAETIIVGTTERSETLWKENSRGDRVIVTRTLVSMREALKGDPDSALWLDVEGGTIDGV